MSISKSMDKKIKIWADNYAKDMVDNILGNAEECNLDISGDDWDEFGMSGDAMESIFDLMLVKLRNSIQKTEY